jgi:hypothetical protein
MLLALLLSRAALVLSIPIPVFLCAMHDEHIRSGHLWQYLPTRPVKSMLSLPCPAYISER